MPNTRAASRAAIKGIDDMDSRIDLIGSQLQKGLDELRSSIMGPNNTVSSAADENGGAQKALQSFEDTVRRTLGELRSEVAAIRTSVQKEYEDIRRQSYSNHIILQGLTEDDGEDICQKVCEFLNSKFHSGLSANDINSCYRLGKKSAGGDSKVRPLAVQFVHRWKRDRIYREKKILKGTGVVIYEMLTVYKFGLLKKVKQLLGVKRCWSRQGNVYAFINGTKTRIETESDILSLSN